VPQQQPVWHLDRFTPILSQVFQANQRLAVLQDFVQQGMQRLLPEAEVV
jgi:phage tail protein X